MELEKLRGLPKPPEIPWASCTPASFQHEKTSMTSMNVFGPCFSGPNMMLTISTPWYCVHMLLAGMGTNGGPTSSMIATAKSAEIDSLVNEAASVI